MTTKTRDEMILVLAVELQVWPKNISAPSYTGWEWRCDYRDAIYLRSNTDSNFQAITELTWQLEKTKPSPLPSGTTLSHLITIRIASLVTTSFLSEAEVIIEKAIEDWNAR